MTTRHRQPHGFAFQAEFALLQTSRFLSGAEDRGGRHPVAPRAACWRSGSFSVSCLFVCFYLCVCPCCNFFSSCLGFKHFFAVTGRLGPWSQQL